MVDSAGSSSEKFLQGRTAIVTGSTSGIGLGIARALAARGANLLINGFGIPTETEKLREGLAGEFGVKVLLSSADLSKADAVEVMVAKAIDILGEIDVLVNNAGIQHVGPIESFPPAKWDALIAVNLSAAFHTTRAVFAGMKARNWGRIINIASAHGLVASPFKSAYVAAKHGLIGLTKVTALEGAEYGVTANAICPGYVWTPLVEKQIPDQAKMHKMSEADVIKNVLLADQPNKKFATTEELGELAAFLCSQAAQSITGAALPVDGGWTAH